MKVNRDQFLEEGYLVVRNVIPPDELDALRRSYERLVEQQKTIWAHQRKPDDPPGGVWETSEQPRLLLHISPLSDQINEQTANAVEIWLHENMQGLSSELLETEDAAVNSMMLMCNPVRDHGPANWHRDLYPPFGAPVQGYVEDIIENGPRYVQWNLSLYDDDVLWVIPRQPRTAQHRTRRRNVGDKPAYPLSQRRSDAPFRRRWRCLHSAHPALG